MEAGFDVRLFEAGARPRRGTEVSRHSAPSGASSRHSGDGRNVLPFLIEVASTARPDPISAEHRNPDPNALWLV
jgi:hypothetical protein